MGLHIWGPLSISFACGIVFRLFVRANTAYRSKIRTYTSRWSFVKANWDVFLIRTFPFNTGLFVVWVLKPGLLSQVVSMAGVPVGVANWITIPPTLGTAFIGGFFVDLFLDQVQIKLLNNPKFTWLPDVLKGEIPSYDPTVAALIQKPQNA